MDYLSLLVAFLTGYAVRGILSHLYLIGRMSDFTKKVASQVDLLLVTVAQDVEFVKTTKYQTLIDSGSDNNLIIRERNMDDYMFGKWKKTIVKTYIDNYPHEFKRHHIKFSNWEEMVQEFNKKQGGNL